METPAVSAVLSQPHVGENQPAITPRPEPPAALGRRAAERMDVSVLICTYNRRQLLGATLDSLAAMHVPPDIRWEVLVVDNNSTDGTRAEVQGRAAAFPAPLRWVFEPRQGKAYALNTGFAAAHPGADLQALRALLRNARKEAKEGKPPRAYRELFRFLRDAESQKQDAEPKTASQG